MTQLIRISFVTVVCLALYGAHSLCNTYQITKRGATYEEASNHPVPFPEFKLLAQVDEKEEFWNNLNKKGN